MGEVTAPEQGGARPGMFGVWVADWCTSSTGLPGVLGGEEACGSASGDSWSPAPGVSISSSSSST